METFFLRKKQLFCIEWPLFFVTERDLKTLVWAYKLEKLLNVVLNT